MGHVHITRQVGQGRAYCGRTFVNPITKQTLVSLLTRYIVQRHFGMSHPSVCKTCAKKAVL